MKTLSIKQPWAYLICSGIKEIENRTWKTKFRGRVLVHASAKDAYIGLGGVLNSIQVNKIMDKLATFEDTCLWDAYRRHGNPERVKSAIIGSVEIVDCTIYHESIWAEKCRLGEPEIYNWVLSNPILFNKPILGVKCKLSFWEYSALNDVAL